jgi:hypothetical protein
VFAQRNQRGSYVNIAGGRCETKHRDLEDTASIELYEESRKSLFIASDVLRDMTARGSFVDYPGDPHHGLSGRRRCFVCSVSHASTTLYNQNKQILDSLISPANPAAARHPAGYYARKLTAYTETDAMIRIPVADIEATLIPGDDGRGRTIGGVYVARFVISGYLRAKAAGLLIRPYKAPNHVQDVNDNQYRDATGIKSGRIDIYRF